MAPKKLTPQQQLQAQRHLVATFIGSSRCGKSVLLTSHLFNIFSSFYAPTLDQVFVADPPVTHPHLPAITYVDVGTGPNTSDRFIPLRTQTSDVVVIVFSVVDKSTLEDAVFRYAVFAKDYNKPIVLVGTKADLRGPGETLAERTDEVIPWEAERYAKKIGATEYVECSALNEEGMADVFEALVRAALGEKVRFGEREG
ncbi:P-loop containing nucleoside triphosphate hydrolase protein [Tricharina praecox]|uniref:P-loop containing nucleoside triphosphate hydrolase protein n=1 Tax=Tricharina praecox TaxID=43433 RepID=UPI00221F3819|nr:P-loop containing nucleoside triphosphate hydrolase protein [Tricharina praecox]KAI5847576.1 P-loop containing nucleoside triphosphate hydrolase protein [Tricharina praecox]